MTGHLTERQREQIAGDAAHRYAAGESWTPITADDGLPRDTVRRLATARHTVTYRPWGAQPAAPLDDVLARRHAGKTIPR